MFFLALVFSFITHYKSTIFKVKSFLYRQRNTKSKIFIYFENETEFLWSLNIKNDHFHFRQQNDGEIFEEERGNSNMQFPILIGICILIFMFLQKILSCPDRAVTMAQFIYFIMVPEALR